MSKSFYHKITDEQWKIIEPHLPKPKSTGRPGINPRTAFNAIFWMLSYFSQVDSTFCKVHQHAAGARKILGNQNIEVSSGGKTTKKMNIYNLSAFL